MRSFFTAVPQVWVILPFYSITFSGGISELKGSLHLTAHGPPVESWDQQESFFPARSLPDIGWTPQLKELLHLTLARS